MTDSLGSKIQINRIRPLKVGKIDFSRKPLEQEPCDYVSRKAVLDKIKEVCFSTEQEWVDFRISQGSNGQRDFIIKFIEDLPSIQPKTEVLDKIRAEIEHLTYYWCEVNPKTVIDDVLQIIDKYKAESEE